MPPLSLIGNAFAAHRSKKTDSKLVTAVFCKSMQIGSATANRIFTWLIVIAFGALAGHGYSVVAYDPPPEILKTWQGARAGAIIAGLFSAFELFVMRGSIGAWVRRRAFLIALLIRVLVHTALIVCALLANRIISTMFAGHIVSHAFSLRDSLQDMAYSFIVVALFLFVLQMRTPIGGRTLLNVVLGRYHRPIREQRLFVLIDLAGSTPLAGKIGDESFHEFLSAFFSEIDAAVTQFGGEIYSYVGDAMITSWPLAEPEHNAKAVEAIFAARKRLERRKPWFKARFGEAPRFRAVLHGGSVVAGECGVSRRQITYLGDVLNTTARLEALSKQLGIDNIISRHLLDQLTLPDDIAAEYLGRHKLKGVAEPMAVNALVRAQPQKPRWTNCPRLPVRCGGGASHIGSALFLCRCAFPAPTEHAHQVDSEAAIAGTLYIIARE